MIEHVEIGPQPLRQPVPEAPDGWFTFFEDWLAMGPRARRSDGKPDVTLITYRPPDGEPLFDESWLYDDKKMNLMPRLFGPFLVFPRPDDQVEGNKFNFFRGSSTGNKRASFVYLVVGLTLSAISFWGFAPAIYWRWYTGQWWRDPINLRTMSLPPKINSFVSLHGLTGMFWLAYCTAMMLTGAASWGGGDASNAGSLRRNMRRLHRWLGEKSIPAGTFFFISCMATLLAGMLAEPLGEGYNSFFVRAVQFFAVALSWLLWIRGLFEGFSRNIAFHKDCMIGSILFATVPTGLPRFGRDLLQWLVGDTCNVSASPEFWFFWCAGYCIIGWPMVFMVARRFHAHKVFRNLVIVNAVILTGLVVVLRPRLSLDPCFWNEYLSSKSSVRAE